MSCLPALPVSPTASDHHREGTTTIVTEAARAVVIGADTHLDTNHLAAITDTGQFLGDKEFDTTPAGYAAAIAWAQDFGAVLIAGVEGTASYGAGLTAALQDAGIDVVEVSRPDRAARRRQGKSDPLDAYAAARTALAGHGLAVPKDDTSRALGALLTARRGAVKARTAAINQIKALLVTAPVQLRERYRHYTTNTTLIAALVGCRPTAHSDPTTIAVLAAAKALAHRVQYLQAQERELTAHLDTVSRQINPALFTAHGVGPDTAAQLLVTAGTNPDRLRSEAAFAALCGAAPVPASSGKITRHRLSRGGDRAANKALHRIALVRMRSHGPTRDYVERQLANGRTKKEILRLLKRAIAREMFTLLTRVCAFDDYSDLRPARQARNITVTAVAEHFGVGSITISRLERGHHRNDTLANTYRHWLTTAA
jgi:transposase